MKQTGFIFDLDGVLVDTAKYHFRSWQRIADSLDFTLDTEVEEQLKGISRMDSLNIVLKEGGLTRTDEEKFKLTEKKNNWYLESLRDLDDSVVLSGVPAFLENIKSLDVPMAVGSASRNATLILERLGMTHYFRSIVDGNMVMKTKPDPEVFINAARNLQIKESNCIIFEDSQKGIKAANTGGFRVIGIGSPEKLTEAEAVIPGFENQNYESILALLN